MTFDFNFDFAEIDHSSQQKPLNPQEQKVLKLLKSLLQHPDNDQIFLLENLSQQLEQEFLPWLVILGEQSTIQADYQLILDLIQSYQWKICHPNLAHCTPLTLGTLSQPVLEQLFNALQIHTCLLEWQTLLELCKHVPSVIGFQQHFSLTAINSFHTRIPLQVEDLTYLTKMLIGENNIKVDLANLITLEIGLPTWFWKNAVLLQQITQSASALSDQQLQKKLQQTDIQTTPLHPSHAALKQLFKRTQSHAQQHLEQMKQQLSLLTQTLLEEDKFSAAEQKMIAELQANTRKETSQLQQHIKQFEQFTQNIENNLQALSV